jgi:hypothetical protein
MRWIWLKNKMNTHVVTALTENTLTRCLTLTEDAVDVDIEDTLGLALLLHTLDELLIASSHKSLIFLLDLFRKEVVDDKNLAFGDTGGGSLGEYNSSASPSSFIVNMTPLLLCSVMVVAILYDNVGVKKCSLGDTC